jgi:hypothetical protein
MLRLLSKVRSPRPSPAPPTEPTDSRSPGSTVNPVGPYPPSELGLL